MIATKTILALSTLLGMALTAPATLHSRRLSRRANITNEITCIDDYTTCGPLSPEGHGTIALCKSNIYKISSICSDVSRHSCRFVNGVPACVPGIGEDGIYMGMDSEALEGEIGEEPLRIEARGVEVERRAASSQLQGMTTCQYNIILKITSTFETGSQALGFDDCGNYNDGQGISAGFIQFTTSSGSALLVVQAYIKKTSLQNPPLKSFIPALQRAAQSGNGGRVSGQGHMDGLWSFCDAWKTAASEDAWAFQQAQIQVQTEEYLVPNKPTVDSLGLKTALGVGLMMDTGIQLGLGAVVTIAKNAGTSPKQGASEAEFIGRYLNARASYLNRLGGAYAETQYRIRCYRHILNSGNLNFSGGRVQALTNDGRPVTVTCDS
ncbi:hypothetical protein HDU67_008816 [Dinochytrium kinnereticum]|nr:hypothetical protein HDU67_008816 [Dinochytrium kinnereticum]